MTPRSCRIALLATSCALLPAVALAAAPDARKPTTAEAAAIRSAALDSLSGKGWRVSNIRVSTVAAKHRFASASVDHKATGAGGEMILRRSRGSWRDIFLGTNDFCEAPAPDAVLRDLGFRC